MIRSGRPIITAAFIQLILLAVQFTLGMWINLFAPSTYTMPFQGTPMGFMMSLMFSIPQLMPHVMNGVIIGLIANMIVFLSILSGNKKLIIMAAGNGLSTFLAGDAGIYFVLGGLQNNGLSFTMSMAFIAVVLTNVGIVYTAIGGPSMGMTEERER